MKRERILVCDKDENYVRAMVAFLIGWESKNHIGISVIGISMPEDMEGLDGDFRLALLGEGFFADNLKVRIKKTVIFTEHPTDDEGSFYKYQSMEGLCAILLGENRLARATENKGNNLTITGIYSPGRHELTLPFSLCVCKSIARRTDVIFIDLSEIGTLPALMGGRCFNEDLIDVIYLMENGELGRGLERFIMQYEGFNILCPVSTPSQLSYITPQQWNRLIEKLKESGFKHIVVLFGSLVQGFADLASKLESLFVLKKTGDYYAIGDRIFMEFMEKLELSSICKEVTLPMSAANLTSGSFRLDALINGNLLNFVLSEEVMGGLSVG